MNENQKPGGIPDRIFKILKDLLLITQHKSSTPGEIENASMKVQEMLLKYNLSLSDVQSRGEKKSVGEKLFDLAGKQGRHDSDWVCSLVNVLAKNNLCRALYFPQHKRMSVIGQDHNVEIVLYLTDQLIPRINQACKDAWVTYQPAGGDEKRNTFRRGFLKGCVAGIASKLQQQKERMEQENNNILALVRVSSTAVNEYVDKKYSLAKPNKNSGKLRKSSDSKFLGFQAGQNMQINKGVGNNPGNKGLIE